jgi:hypothetical protein
VVITDALRDGILAVAIVFAVGSVLVRAGPALNAVRVEPMRVLRED